MKSIGSISSGDDETFNSAESKEKSHTWSLDTTGIRRGKIAKTRGRTLRAVNASTAFATAIILDNVVPGDAENMNRMGRGGDWTRDGMSEGTSVKVAGQLRVKSGIPGRPVWKTFELTASQTLERTFFRSHVGGL